IRRKARHLENGVRSALTEKPRFRGTCYHAANWIHLGETKGRGKLGPHGILGVPVKDIWVYPMNQNFKMLLCQ
ncbi:MAG: DUF4338 domain-containing protein, partial [Magnetococcales bacterium]|nr:DUF4338 domain-containing protein [Magnetococcales bacterium]